MSISLDHTTSVRWRRVLVPAVICWALGSTAFPGGVSAGVLAAPLPYLAANDAGPNQKNASGVTATVDLNTATADQFAAALSGVGASKAKAIVRYRTEVGPFRDVRELEEVKGIGPRILAVNKERITVSKPKG